MTTAIRRMATLPVLAYRYLISPFTPASCRYRPSCSAYALEAIESHGVMRGGGLALRRMARCHPWGGDGYDPVPAPASKDLGR